VYLSGSWLLIKNPDHELASSAESNISYYDVDQGSVVSTSVTQGQEISDMLFAFSEVINGEATVTSGQLYQFSADTAYPINKLPIDWNVPIGGANDASSPRSGFTVRNAADSIWSVSEFCTDCHDGNAGLHTTEVPVFSEDRALRAAQNNSPPPIGRTATTWRTATTSNRGSSANASCGLTRRTDRTLGQTAVTAIRVQAGAGRATRSPLQITR